MAPRDLLDRGRLLHRRRSRERHAARKIAGYLHGGRGTLTSDGARRTWNYSADRYGPAAQLHSWIAAPGATVAEKKGELTYIKGDFAEFPYLEVNATAGNSAWLTLLKPARAGDTTAFSAEDRSTAAYSAFAISAADQRCLVAAQSKPGARLKLDDIETDAAFVLVRRDLAGRVLAFSVLEGTSLSVSGREIWRAAQPQSAARILSP